MSLNVSEKSGSIELIEEGVYPARCIGVIDLGTQLVNFNDKDKEVHQIRLDFEIPGLTFEYEDKETKEKITGTKVIGKILTASLSGKATLRKMLESWRGQKFTKEELAGFSLGDLLGKTCQLQVLHSDDGKWANLENLMPMMKGVEVAAGVREPLMFSMEEDKVSTDAFCDMDVFNKLPEFLQDKIGESREMRKHFGHETLEEQEVNMKKEAEAKKAQAPTQTAPAESVSEEAAAEVFETKEAKDDFE